MLGAEEAPPTAGAPGDTIPGIPPGPIVFGSKGGVPGGGSETS
jgi:hypothetical protein